MRERKLRSAAESLARMKGSAISCTITLYKTRRESKRKNTIRICSSLESRLKQQWDQMFWPAKKLGCGIAVRAQCLRPCEPEKQIQQKEAPKPHLSPEGRRRIIEATKRRWATKKMSQAGTPKRVRFHPARVAVS